MSARLTASNRLAQMPAMTPTTRKIIYAVSFETLGILVEGAGLLLLTDVSPFEGVALAAFGAGFAVVWSFAFNSVFEAWEARQSKKGRPLCIRVLHTIGFEGSLTVMMAPALAWWLDVPLLRAAGFEIALIALFIVYTYIFTWGFDRIFGLPASARPH